MHVGSIQVRLLGILAIGMICSLIACSGGGAGSASAAVPASSGAVIVGVAVTPNSTVITTGDSIPLTATVSGTSNTAVTWSVDGIVNGNATVGTVSGTGGVVTYTAPGSAGSHVLTVTSLADSQKHATSTIVVQPPSEVVNVTLSPGMVTLATGASQSFIATVSNSANTSVTWTIDGLSVGNTTLGTIAGNGLDTTYTAPLTAGDHLLVATSVADPTKSASASITVVVPNSVTAVAVSPATLSLNTGATNQFAATVAGTGSYSSAVTWTAQKGTISSTGLYTAPATGGSDVVTAKSTQDTTKTASSTITVAVPNSVTSVAVSPATLSLNTGATNQFSATVAGTGSYSSAVTWTAQKGTISSTGLYTAPATSGSDVVTATSAQDATKTASAAITVAVPNSVTSVAVSPATLSLSTSATNQFSATVAGTGNYSSTVIWTAQKGTITSAGCAATITPVHR